MIDLLKRLPVRILLALIRLYQLTLSPWMGQQCRFYPTCSHYAGQAIAQSGAVRGSWLALQRLLKCHPFHSGGFDPVPEGVVVCEVPMGASTDSSQLKPGEPHTARHWPTDT